MEVNKENLAPSELEYLSRVLAGGDVDLGRIWALVDAAWEDCGCDPEVMDERIARFYAHPVWLLNGLFIEQDSESKKNRHDFTEYVSGLKPKRIADFGGGFGFLARMIGERCPDAEVHIIEPHPTAAAVSLAAATANVRYLPDFKGEYDVLIATDVFEHVPDPLALVESTAAHLRPGGEYLIANCFWPVMNCHLPSTFHFRWSWDAAMAAMNLVPGKAVAYGRAYKRSGLVSSSLARAIEGRSKRWFGLIERTPARFRARVARFLITGDKKC